MALPVPIATLCVMPHRAQSRRSHRLPRLASSVLAAVLILAAVFLVVLGSSQKQVQLGVLLGLWGALIGAFLVAGSRRGQPDQANSTQALQLRTFGELQVTREAAARREADLALELSLRRELERLMSDQLGFLRSEVAALRAEVADKLGGQLRLERIETTRVIGSDLDALQHQIRRLSTGTEPGLTEANMLDAELIEADAVGASNAPESYQGRRRADRSQADSAHG